MVKAIVEELKNGGHKKSAVNKLQSLQIWRGHSVIQEQAAAVLKVVLLIFESKMDYLRVKRKKYHVFYAVYITSHLVFGLKSFTSFRKRHFCF